MRRRIILWSVACLLAIAAPTTATTVTMSATPPPPGDVVIAVDVADDVGCYLCSHGRSQIQDLGQTFRPPVPFTLAKITLKVRALTEETPGESVTLFLGTFSDPNDVDMDEVLTTATVDLPPDLPVGEVRYLTFHLAGLDLEADQQYGFRFAFTGYGCVYNARIDLLHTADDAYPDGLAVQTAGTVATPLGFDLVFYLHDSNISSIIFADGFESGDTSMWSNGSVLPWEHDRASMNATEIDR